ncbi:hypothetical protein [Burkholderia ubonensis]|nr:hypothetical protein [Burkholderia ubonensis]
MHETAAATAAAASLLVPIVMSRHHIINPIASQSEAMGLMMW